MSVKSIIERTQYPEMKAQCTVSLNKKYLIKNNSQFILMKEFWIFILLKTMNYWNSFSINLYFLLSWIHLLVLDS